MKYTISQIPTTINANFAEGTWTDALARSILQILFRVDWARVLLLLSYERIYTTYRMYAYSVRRYNVHRSMRINARVYVAIQSMFRTYSMQTGYAPRNMQVYMHALGTRSHMYETNR